MHLGTAVLAMYRLIEVQNITSVRLQILSGKKLLALKIVNFARRLTGLICQSSFPDHLDSELLELSAPSLKTNPLHNK